MRIPHSTPPHGENAVLVAGNSVSPTRALILLHGRGATAEHIISIATHLNVPEDVLVLAPQAAFNTWYPERFIRPQQTNQPGLDSALERMSTLVAFLEYEFKIPTEQIALAGFSQGACLVAEYLKRNPGRYLAAAIYSGGLIGDEAEVNQTIEGSFNDTPMYMGCDNEDLHIPHHRVSRTASYLNERHANVTLAFYSHLGHTIHEEGFKFLREALSKK